MSLDFYLGARVDTGAKCPIWVEVWRGNYTHNVTPMWRLAGVYQALYWSDGERAGTLVPVLSRGCRAMRDNIAAYRALNPSNGWGDADRALVFLGRVTAACKRHPKAEVRISK